MLLLRKIIIVKVESVESAGLKGYLVLPVPSSVRVGSQISERPHPIMDVAFFTIQWFEPLPKGCKKF